MSDPATRRVVDVLINNQITANATSLARQAIIVTVSRAATGTGVDNYPVSPTILVASGDPTPSGLVPGTIIYSP